jgi:hypothetical protein
MLTNLPRELLGHIYTFCARKDAHQLAVVCKRTREVLHADPWLYEQIVLADPPYGMPCLNPVTGRQPIVELFMIGRTFDDNAQFKRVLKLFRNWPSWVSPPNIANRDQLIMIFETFPEDLIHIYFDYQPCARVPIQTLMYEHLDMTEICIVNDFMPEDNFVLRGTLAARRAFLLGDEAADVTLTPAPESDLDSD